MQNHTPDCRVHDDASCCDCGLIAFQKSQKVLSEIEMQEEKS